MRENSRDHQKGVIQLLRVKILRTSEKFYLSLDLFSDLIETLINQFGFS